MQFIQTQLLEVSGLVAQLTIQGRPPVKEVIRIVIDQDIPSLGSEAGKNAPGTSCPPGHSKAFCNAYIAAAGSSANNNNNQRSSSTQQVNTAHCDRSGYPSCYSLGHADEQNHPGTSCPSGHSATYCAGWN